MSTTKVTKVTNSVEAWSAESGMTSRAFNAGLSFPLGKTVSVGAKFGFEREQTSEHTSDSKSTGLAFTVVHEIPTVQINLNESTVLLSPDAESDIKKLRKERNFSDLLSFFDKYGMFISTEGKLANSQ